MDANRFGALTRRLDSRRRILAAALACMPILGLSEGATARRRKKGNRNRRNCKHHAIKICTGDVCGKRKSNCGKRYTCHCSEGKTCLPNGSCAVDSLGSCDGQCVRGEMQFDRGASN